MASHLSSGRILKIGLGGAGIRLRVFVLAISPQWIKLFVSKKTNSLLPSRNISAGRVTKAFPLENSMSSVYNVPLIEYETDWVPSIGAKLASTVFSIDITISPNSQPLVDVRSIVGSIYTSKSAGGITKHVVKPHPIVIISSICTVNVSLVLKLNP